MAELACKCQWCRAGDPGAVLDSPAHPGGYRRMRSSAPDGEVVAETFAYDGGRTVWAYVPAAEPQAIVFGGDGPLLLELGRSLGAAGLPPIMVLAADRSSSTDEMDRLKEYSPVFDDERFAAHERFFTEDVLHWVRSRFDVALPPDRTVISGASASAEFSLAMGLRHPDLFGLVFAASPGAGFRPPETMPRPLPRAYLTAGTLEPFFLENASRWADALRLAGADVVFTQPVGGHGDPFWRLEFLNMLAWAFPS